MLMRREKTLKICANFYLDPSITLKENAGSDRAWVWRCMDFSEEKQEMSLLALRLANSENAQTFKDNFEKCVAVNAEKDGASTSKDVAEEGAKDDAKSDESKDASKDKAPAEEAKDEAKEAPVDAN